MIVRKITQILNLKYVKLSTRLCRQTNLKSLRICRQGVMKK